MRYLNTSEYDSILLAALRESGLTDGAARRLIQSRWPLCAVGVVSEASGRGLLVQLGDIDDFVREMTGTGLAEDDDFEVEIVDAFLRWAVESGRAKLTAIGKCLQRPDADRKIKARCRVAAAGTN